MRRALPALAVLALLAASGAPGQAAAPSTERASAASPRDAAAARHSPRCKRAFRTRLRRVSSRRRRARIRAVRRRCRRAVARKPGSSLVPTPAVPGPGSGAPPGEPLGRRLQVQSREYFLTLSRPAVLSGTVTVEMVNRGEDPHDLKIRRSDRTGPVYSIGETPSLGRGSGAFALNAGNWYLYCSLDGHEALGMSAALDVR